MLLFLRVISVGCLVLKGIIEVADVPGRRLFRRKEARELRANAEDSGDAITIDQ